MQGLSCYSKFLVKAIEPFVPDMFQHFRKIDWLDLRGNNYTIGLEWPELLQDKDVQKADDG